MSADPSSYRDPSGHVHIEQNRVFRTVTPFGSEEYRAVRDSGALSSLVQRRMLVEAQEIKDAPLRGIGKDDLVLEHPRLPIISYPYEWPFEALKAAALLHLDIQLELLDKNIALSDASAFNIQFQGGKPVFIDYLSFRRYRKNEIWLAHRQFCEQFLNPLVLEAVLGVPFQAWYRGQPEGIPAREVAKVLKFRHKLSPVILSHVVLHARLQEKTDDALAETAGESKKRGLPKPRFRAILLQLRRYIEKLTSRAAKDTAWVNYATENTYESDESAAKLRFVERFVGKVRPTLLVDLGCNTGTYSATAIASGAELVVGLDNDHGALHSAFALAREQQLNFLPLYQDLANPTPALGWNEAERPGLGERLAGANGVLALAFVHHLAIARNIPLVQIVEKICHLAREGVIEFIPKDDPTIQKMLLLRDDVFSGYTVERFTNALAENAEIIERQVISSSGRELFHFRRR